jgi:hypothetical protein
MANIAVPRLSQRNRRVRRSNVQSSGVLGHTKMLSFLPPMDPINLISLAFTRCPLFSIRCKPGMITQLCISYLSAFSNRPFQLSIMSTYKQLSIFIVPRPLVTDPDYYKSLLSKHCFVDMSLLSPPSAVRERDFALVGVLGEDYTTFVTMKPSCASLLSMLATLAIQCSGQFYRISIQVGRPDQTS